MSDFAARDILHGKYEQEAVAGAFGSKEPGHGGPVHSLPSMDGESSSRSGIERSTVSADHTVRVP
jgi:hypothetical protein